MKNQKIENMGERSFAHTTVGKSISLSCILFFIFMCPLLLQAGLCTTPEDNEMAFSTKDPFLGDWKGTLNGKSAYGMLTAFENNEYVLRIYDKELLTREEYIAPILYLLGTRKDDIIKFHSHYIEVKIMVSAHDFRDMDIAKKKLAKKSPHIISEKMIEGDTLTVTFNGITGKVTSYKKNVKNIIELKKIEDLRKSPTLGMKPPENAVVLFDGTTFDNWKPVFNKRIQKTMDKKGIKEEKIHWKLIDGTMQIVPKFHNLFTKQSFGDCSIHVEFMMPYLPQHRLDGYYRCNSGVYICGNFEIQLIDSYAAYGFAPGTCGGIYGKKPADYFACRPPLTWQTYDIDFIAPKFDASGKKIKDGQMSVKFNGILIHKDIVLDHRKPTKKNNFMTVDPTGPIFLQDHSWPVRFRNIWVVENND